MSTIQRVSYVILSQYGQMDSDKLQLLAYYCQAHYLSTTHYDLFKNDFQAWSRGPVCLELFKTVSLDNETVSLKNIVLSPCELAKPFKCSTLRSIYNICESLNTFSTKTLADRAKSELPWIDARKNLKPEEPSEVEISHKLIHDYYAKNPIIDLKTASSHSRNVEDAIEHVRKLRLERIRQDEKIKQEVLAEKYYKDEESRQIRRIELELLNNISVLDEFKNMSDPCVESRAKLISRRFGRQIYRQQEALRKAEQEEQEKLEQEKLVKAQAYEQAKQYWQENKQNQAEGKNENESETQAQAKAKAQCE